MKVLNGIIDVLNFILKIINPILKAIGLPELQQIPKGKDLIILLVKIVALLQ